MTEKERKLREEYFDNDKYSGTMTLTEFFNARGFEPKAVENKAGGKIKRFKNGGLARRKRSIARGCGAIMENKRKKTLYT
jgi:hypothetical protein